MFEGAMVAMVTPFKNGQVDINALRMLCAKLIDGGIDTLVPTGTTGEAATLSFEEHAMVIGHVIEEAKGRAKVLAGTGSNSTKEAILLTKAAKEKGADGALLITPYYNKPTQEGLFAHFEAVAREVMIPIVLYNIPGRTSVKLEISTISKLAKIHNIVGIKESCGSLEMVMDIMNACPSDFEVYSGEDALNVSIIAVGGKGVISVLGNLVPEKLSKMARLGLNGNIKDAVKVQLKLLPLIHALFLETNPIPIKAALSMRKEIKEEYRLPMVKMSEKNKIILKDEMRKLELL